MKKIIMTILTILILSCNMDTVSQTPDLSGLSQPDALVGLWFLGWAHSSDPAGPGYSPGSYGYAENPNYEEFYLLNSDGSGYRVERYMNIIGNSGTIYQDTINNIGTDDNITYTVVTKKDGIVTEEDVLSRKENIFWGINNNDEIIIYLENHIKPYEKTTTAYELDPANKRCEGTRTIDKYLLGVELDIKEHGAFQKVGSVGAAEYINRYSL